MHPENALPQRLVPVVLSLFSLLVLLWPACYNGFPLVYPDTGAYISSGLRLSVHPDRPIGYGLFILFTSLGISLWFVVIAQALLINWLIRRLTQSILGPLASGTMCALVVLLLSLCTSVAWYTGQLMPDIFTSALLLCLLLFFRKRDDKKKARLYGWLMFFLLATHNSHTVILLALGLVLLLFFWSKKMEDYLVVARKVFLIAVAMFVVQSGIYMIGGYGFGLSPASPVFMVSRMVENGILDAYLEETCPVEHFELCDYQGRLGTRQWDFMWSDEFPHNKKGWIAVRPEYNRIIRGTFTTPKYLGLHILKSLEGTLKLMPQLFVNDALGAEKPGSNTDKNIGLYYGHQLKEFRASVQAHDLLEPVAERDNLLIVCFAIAMGACVLWFNRNPGAAHHSTGTDWTLLFGLTLLFLVLNAWTTATFSTVVSRFQARVFWVLPFLCLLFILQYGLARSARLRPGYKQ